MTREPLTILSEAIDELRKSEDDLSVVTREALECIRVLVFRSDASSIEYVSEAAMSCIHARGPCGLEFCCVCNIDELMAEGKS